MSQSSQKLAVAAIFSRNHRKYIEAACKRRGRRTTFRAQKTWATAERAIDQHGTRPIYIAPNGSKFVEYEADLQEVVLAPRRGSRTTETLLADCLPETSDEGLWEDGKGTPKVGTLYAIANCRKLAKKFPFTRLLKLSDRKPIDEEFKYDYSIVFASERRSK